jgi:cysteinyl-tRNA synthetase
MKILKLKNSLTNKVDLIELNQQRELKMYLCGPTVYDHVHIGNMRPSIILDIIVRLLEEEKIKFKYIQNITDIDDKIINKSEIEGKNEEEISSYYKNSYLENFKNLNLKLPTNFPTVTSSIKEIIKLVENLVKSEDAYILGDNVLFNIEKNIKEYGELSKQDLEKLSREEGRKVNKSEKINEKDFVLWKKTLKGINWETPWFRGRPGWHTECAALIEKFFSKETIDIHAGGKDLIFPHHENERIQFLSLNKKELSKIWIHFGHVTMKNEKMSKSLGNYLTAKEFIEKYGANVLRHLILNSRYKDDIEIDESIINQSISQIKKIENILKKINLFLYSNNLKIEDLKNWERKEEIINSLLNDIETTKTLFILEESIYFINKEIDKDSNKEKLKRKINDLFLILNLMGFNFKFEKYSKETINEIEEWKKMIEIKNFEKADEIRKILQEKQII